jgi:hypothetical protein
VDSAPIVDDLIIAAVPCTMIDLVWDRIEPLIQMAVDKAPDDITVEMVKKRLVRGDQGLVTISRGADIIAINTLDVKVFDTGIRVLFIPITAGTEMELWLERFLEIAVAIAKDYNCTELRGLAARGGWLRKLKPLGWEEVFTTIRYKFGE